MGAMKPFADALVSVALSLEPVGVDDESEGVSVSVRLMGLFDSSVGSGVEGFDL